MWRFNICTKLSERSQQNSHLEGLDLSNFDLSLASCTPVMESLDYRYAFFCRNGSFGLGVNI